MHQVLAYESDLLEYGDIFEGSHIVEARTAELVETAQAELDEIIARGGAFAEVETLKAGLVASMAKRTRRIESGEQVVVGVNRFTESEPSPLVGDGAILRVDPAVEAEAVRSLNAWRADRNQAAVDTALAELRRAAVAGDNIMPPSIALAQAGGTTGEWGDVMREVFGEYRGPTGVAGATGAGATTRQTDGESLEQVGDWVRTLDGGPPKLLVAKPGLDGHSNGAEQIAVAARDAGMEVVYSGIRVTSEQIAASARDEDPDVIGLSVLSGSHLDVVPDVIAELARHGVDAPVVVGGIIPENDRARLVAAGVAAVYTPKDFDLARIMREIAELACKHRSTHQ
jgi:(2R)-ethylmalonyl-CoA mutase